MKYIKDLVEGIGYWLLQCWAWLSTRRLFEEWNPQLRASVLTCVLILYICWLLVGSGPALLVGLVTITLLPFAIVGRLLPITLWSLVVTIGIKSWSWFGGPKATNVDQFGTLKDRFEPPKNFELTLRGRSDDALKNLTSKISNFFNRKTSAAAKIAKVQSHVSGISNTITASSPPGILSRLFYSTIEVHPTSASNCNKNGALKVSNLVEKASAQCEEGSSKASEIFNTKPTYSPWSFGIFVQAFGNEEDVHTSKISNLTKGLFSKGSSLIGRFLSRRKEEISSQASEAFNTPTYQAKVAVTIESVNWYDITGYFGGKREAPQSQASESLESVATQAYEELSVKEEGEKFSSYASGVLSAIFNGHQSSLDAFESHVTGDVQLPPSSLNLTSYQSNNFKIPGGLAISCLHSLGDGFIWVLSKALRRIFNFFTGSTIDSTASFLVHCTTCWIPVLIYTSGALLLLWAGSPYIDSVISRAKHRPPPPIAAVFSLVTWVPALIMISVSIAFQYHSAIVGWVDILQNNSYLLAFIVLALFKGIKIVVNTFSYFFLSSPAQRAANPILFPADVTVIVPTVGDLDDEFELCIRSILANRPAQVIVSTVSLQKQQTAIQVCRRIDPHSVKVVAILRPNKREQFIHAANSVRTPITCYADDHVVWPFTFLRSSLAPFEDPIVGIVGTVKRVIRQRGKTVMESFLNYIACIYLERHNFECTATYNLDGGVFVISGRTALVRTEIIHSLEYRQGFLNEHWLGIGPMKVDDDNFTTRFMVKKGFKTIFHNHPEALMETTLGTTGGIEKFKGQLLRWVRTTWRSNSTSLIVDRVCWRSYPWTTYAMFLSSFVNFALFYDPALVYTLYKATGTKYLCPFSFCLFLTKLIKPFPHLVREPRDVGYFFGGIVFGYMHSLVKLWALFTANNMGWTGRTGIAATGR